MSEPRLSALTVEQVRERLGREPTMAEWIVIIRGARAEHDFIGGVERTRELLGPRRLTPNDVDRTR